MNESLVSTKGQIVIPQEFRERYHLHPNSKTHWVDMGGVLIVAPKLANPVFASRGILKNSKLTQKALQKERRKEKRG